MATMDKQRRAEFLSRMTGIMNGGALSLMCSIGHKTGLFDTMSTMEPATSHEIAEAAGLNERYVREWLAAVSAGGVVDYDADAGTFHLPPEHAGLLTRASGPLNLTTYCQYVALLGQVEDEVVTAFKEGGGVPYDRYPAFQTLVAESSGQRLDKALISQVVPLLPGGYDRLAAGIDVADVGCGSGRALNLLAAEFPQSRFTGFDIAEHALERGRAMAAERGSTNITFEAADAARIAHNEEFDLITTFDAIHDQAKPDTVLKAIFNALRPGGTYLCVEPKASSHLHENLDLPMAPMMYTISTMHCMTVSLAYDGDGLGTAWGEQLAIEKLTDAGFVDIQVTGIADDRANNYFIAAKPGGATAPGGGA
jgi:2-polyprenyl-3-methyl-5-hydroxy-6-metoxy-1,4-benzoquinol methylase